MAIFPVRKISRQFAGTAVLGAASLALAACGGGDDQRLRTTLAQLKLASEDGLSLRISAS